LRLEKDLGRIQAAAFRKYRSGRQSFVAPVDSSWSRRRYRRKRRIGGMMVWKRVASVGDIHAGKGLQVDVDDKTIALFLLNGSVFAIEGICPHSEAYLAEGFIDGDKVECPLHQALFHIPTGKCVEGPSDRDLCSFPVKIEADQVLVEL
jgi:nitrite reductase/ring-hydroxylating ferredoxin subunit